MTYQDNDLQIIRRIAANDENALQDLYVIYGQRMYALALRLTCDPGLADEAIQESLVTIWQKASHFRGDGRLIAWLLSIVHHKAFSLLRQKPTSSLDDHDNEPASDAPSPDRLVVMAEQRQVVHTGLSQLSTEHRAVLELVFYQGLSLNEVAEVCGCPVGTVKSRLSYAKNMLRGLLNRQGIDAEDVE